MDNDTRGRADVKCISVLCRIARCGNGVNVEIFQNGVLGAAHTEMSAWGLNNFEATEHGIGGVDGKYARSISKLFVVPKEFRGWGYRLIKHDN